MSVCIVARYRKNTIITATDRKISFGSFFSSEGNAKKLLPVRDNWVAMVAGTDISPSVPILNAIRASKKESKTVEQFAAICRDAFRQERQIAIESEVLGRYGMAMAEFKRHNAFPPNVYEHIVSQIDSVKLKCTFLFAGFDEKPAPHILTLSEPGNVQYQDRSDFWAIGAGQHNAMSSLAQYPSYNCHDSIGACVYRVIAAKLSAESARDVGRPTYIGIYCRDQRVGISLSGEIMDEVRQKWMELAARIPEDVEERILFELAACGWFVKTHPESAKGEEIRLHSASDNAFPAFKRMLDEGSKESKH